MKMKKILPIFVACLLLFTTACKNENVKTKENNETKLTIHKYPERIKTSIIYEVNIRQYTPEGTFNAFVEHIPRLKELGVEILWIMPIHPVGEKNRKGTLGSYYAVKDYKAVNPEFGTKEDFANLIKVAHENNMLIILDWVANHTAWDNPWIKANPEWYTQDEEGNIIAPVDDWSDVADLNYDNKEMRATMIDALKYWVSEFDVDGYRCDVAMMVPTDFWNEARAELDKVKPVFMLAEAEDELDLFEKAFDMRYAWELLHLTENVAKGEKNANDLIEYFERNQKKYEQRMLKMPFTSNHDENSWNGTVFERYPDCHKTFAVFTYVIPGMPLIYSGQEACLDKQLEFFEKDEIEWKTCNMTELYTSLATLKIQNEALWNGEFGGIMEIVEIKENEKIFSFVREKNDNKVLVIFNFSDTETEIKINDEKAFGTYAEYFSHTEIEISKEETYKLDPWAYWILIK